MRVLLDTHIALWAAEGASLLSSQAARLIEDPSNMLLVSAAAIWEIAIKHAKGNLRVHPRDARSVFASPVSSNCRSPATTRRPWRCCRPTRITPIPSTG
ncbi:hypothetical protein SAMN05192563_1001511 [Paraburkholderia aspalathi]|uniref:PIN domain nuclease, a component of toxin-antitoxin system (PIN domain) n=1 Tax=Paraburkholderia aspalathi TaxID=1324617 RepID=A0A1I6YIT5_9BURK|nr:hypothetical protein SAMN05192563_1001511 [Paraburkholderia aspalathi]